LAAIFFAAVFFAAVFKLSLQRARSGRASILLKMAGLQPFIQRCDPHFPFARFISLETSMPEGQETSFF
jgi:hypothetical protein